MTYNPNAGATIFGDNGDGTGTLTVDPTGPFTLVDNGDGTGTLTLNGVNLTLLTRMKPLFTPIGNQWYAAWSGGLATFAMVLNTLYAWPIFMPSAMAISTARIEVTTAGSAGSTVRSGFYHSKGDGPDWSSSGLISDLGTIDSSSTGMKDYTIGGAGLTLPYEMIWFCSVAQGGTAPTVRTMGAGATTNMLPFAGTPGSNVGNLGIQVTGISGALPTTAQTNANLVLTPFPMRLTMKTP